jgi:hypothetical protein
MVPASTAGSVDFAREILQRVRARSAILRFLREHVVHQYACDAVRASRPRARLVEDRKCVAALVLDKPAEHGVRRCFVGEAVTGQFTISAIRGAAPGSREKPGVTAQAPVVPGDVRIQRLSHAKRIALRERRADVPAQLPALAAFG